MKTLESLLTVKKRNMKPEEVEVFIFISMAYLGGENISEEIKENFIFNVLNKRLIYFKVPVDDWLKVFISALCDSPGKAVMWAYALYQMHKKIQRELNVHDFSDIHYFGMGLPEESEYKRIWDLQKVKPDYPKSDNALDDPEYWQ